jgi:hypothetical protein
VRPHAEARRNLPDRIVISGALAQRPGVGGHAWVFLQYLLGFRRLGYDVLFVDWLDEAICGGPVPLSRGATYLHSVMEEFGLAECYSLLDRGTGVAVRGVTRRDVVRRTRESALLLNVMGYLDDEEILGSASLPAFLDIDPGFPQMWRELGLADVFAGHERFITIGERIGRKDCAIPTHGLDWVTTPQPVVLERWPARPLQIGPFTSVCSWRGAFGPVEYHGTTYGLRVHEFRKLSALPSLSGETFELALDIDDADRADREQLEEDGWLLVDPRAVAQDPSSYQAYIARSKGELMVAKSMYVQTRSGWFSDRSSCYLATGRPVVAQDTGVGDLYGEGEGLLLFATLSEAAERVSEVARDYRRHARAARSLAEEIFDSDRVLRRLVDRLGVG